MIESFHRLLQKLFCRLGHVDTKAQIGRIRNTSLASYNGFVERSCQNGITKSCLTAPLNLHSRHSWDFSQFTAAKFSKAYLSVFSKVKTSPSIIIRDPKNTLIATKLQTV